MTDAGTDGKPAAWPNVFSNGTRECMHQYAWDDSDHVYRCVYCSDERDNPHTDINRIEEGCDGE